MVWLKASWISHAFVVTCCRQLQSCICFCQQRNLLLLFTSFLWQFEALWGPKGCALPSPLLTTVDTYKGNQTPLQWKLCVYCNSSSAQSVIESSVNWDFPLSLLSPWLYFWSCHCGVLYDSSITTSFVLTHLISFVMVPLLQVISKSVLI